MTIQSPYELLAEDILRRIRSGEWKQGGRIPTVRELCDLYPHSRMTIHKAIRHLVARGYLDTARGRGTRVRATHIRDRVAILVGGTLGPHERSPAAAAAADLAGAYLTNRGFDARLYAEDPLAPARMPASLIEDLESRRLKGLLTIMSCFPYRHMRTAHWRRFKIPHIDIGSVNAPRRVYIDFDAFIRRALALARREGRTRPLLIAKATPFPPDELRARYASRGVTVLDAVDGLPPTMSHEEWGFRAMCQVWQQPDACDAVIAPEDAFAKGVAQAAMACRIAVPDQVLIVALTNRGLGPFYPVPVVRFEVDIADLVSTAGEGLTDLMAGKPVTEGARLLAPVHSAQADPCPACPGTPTPRRRKVRKPA